MDKAKQFGLRAAQKGVEVAQNAMKPKLEWRKKIPHVPIQIEAERNVKHITEYKKAVESLPWGFANMPNFDRTNIKVQVLKGAAEARLVVRPSQTRPGLPEVIMIMPGNLERPSVDNDLARKGWDVEQLTPEMKAHILTLRQFFKLLPQFATFVLNSGRDGQEIYDTFAQNSSVPEASVAFVELLFPENTANQKRPLIDKVLPEAIVSSLDARAYRLKAETLIELLVMRQIEGAGGFNQALRGSYFRREEEIRHYNSMWGRFRNQFAQAPQPRQLTWKPDLLDYDFWEKAYRKQGKDPITAQKNEDLIEKIGEIIKLIDPYPEQTQVAYVGVEAEVDDDMYGYNQQYPYQNQNYGGNMGYSSQAGYGRNPNYQNVYNPQYDQPQPEYGQHPAYPGVAAGVYASNDDLAALVGQVNGTETKRSQGRKKDTKEDARVRKMNPEQYWKHVKRQVTEASSARPPLTDRNHQSVNQQLFDSQQQPVTYQTLYSERGTANQPYLYDEQGQFIDQPLYDAIGQVINTPYSTPSYYRPERQGNQGYYQEQNQGGNQYAPAQQYDQYGQLVQQPLGYDQYGQPVYPQSNRPNPNYQQSPYDVQQQQYPPQGQPPYNYGASPQPPYDYGQMLPPNVGESQGRRRNPPPEQPQYPKTQTRTRRR
jgi:hypothetical protein